MSLYLSVPSLFSLSIRVILLSQNEYNKMIVKLPQWFVKFLLRICVIECYEGYKKILNDCESILKEFQKTSTNFWYFHNSDYDDICYFINFLKQEIPEKFRVNFFPLLLKQNLEFKLVHTTFSDLPLDRPRFVTTIRHYDQTLDWINKLKINLLRTSHWSVFDAPNLQYIMYWLNKNGY